MKLSYKQRAANGAKLLDEIFPGWHAKIDVKILDINSGLNCILGQAYGDWHDGLTEISRRLDVNTEDLFQDDWQAEHGFNFSTKELTEFDADGYYLSENASPWLVKRWSEEVTKRNSEV